MSTYTHTVWDIIIKIQTQTKKENAITIYIQFVAYIQTCITHNKKYMPRSKEFAITIKRGARTYQEYLKTDNKKNYKIIFFITEKGSHK